LMRAASQGPYRSRLCHPAQHTPSAEISEACPRYHFDGLHRRAPDCLFGPLFGAHPL
jgi:hypothetical protein